MPLEGVQAAESLFFLDSGLFFWPLVGMTVHFLARGDVPHLRRQAIIGQPDLRGPKFVRQAEDAAMRQGGATIAGPLIGICAIVVGNFIFYGFTVLRIQ
jgi:hypothetical protein